VTLGGAGRPLVAAMTLGPIVGLATHRHMGLMLWWKPFDRDDLATVTSMMAAGTVRPAIDRRYPLDDIVAALEYADGGARGKVIVTA
jgi:NADPH:quinone reductase-like Zn-dependent oxidoreductase